MGTTLTGTTPQDTYDSLIKVTDNGPLSGTAKYLSDGLGNDSALALSTSAAGVGTTTMVRKFNIDGGSITSDTPTLRISSTDGSGTRKFGIEFYSNNGADVRGRLLADNNGKVYLDDLGGGGVILAGNGGSNVGIGTSTPATTLHLDASGGATIRLQRTSASSNRFDVGTDGTNMEFNVRDTGSFTFGGSSSYLRLLSGTGGIQFNGDTAAANALDDYEEGTFTATLVPPTSGTITLDPTYSTWSYTKIGRKVTINGVAVISSVSSPVGSYFTMATLPFTIITANSGYGSGSAILSDQSLSYAKSSVPIWHSVGNVALNFGLDASTLAAGDELYVTATYFV